MVTGNTPGLCSEKLADVDRGLTSIEEGAHCHLCPGVHAPSRDQNPTRTPCARESWGPRSHHFASSCSTGANPDLITFRRLVDSEVENQTLLGRRGKRVSGTDSHAGRASRTAPDTVCPGPDGLSGSISGPSQASASLLPTGVRGWSSGSGKSWGRRSTTGRMWGGGHLTGALALELLSGSLVGICGRGCAGPRAPSCTHSAPRVMSGSLLSPDPHLTPPPQGRTSFRSKVSDRLIDSHFRCRAGWLPVCLSGHVQFLASEDTVYSAAINK